MAFDFGNGVGESFGDINDVFFKKGGKSIIPQPTTSGINDKVSLADVSKKVSDIAQNANITNNKNGMGQTIINISKDVIGMDEDLVITLSILEEKRKNISSVRNKYFIDIDSGDEIMIVEQTELYNGTNLYIAKDLTTNKTITYPRSMFVGKTKKFVPKEFYIREAERAIEDTIDNNFNFIFDMVKNENLIGETPDGRYLELILDESLNIIGGMRVPDKIQIPVKRMFDLDYKILMLEYVICLDNKIAGLIFNDIWF